MPNKCCEAETEEKRTPLMLIENELKDEDKVKMKKKTTCKGKLFDPVESTTEKCYSDY